MALKDLHHLFLNHSTWTIRLQIPSYALKYFNTKSIIKSTEMKKHEVEKAKLIRDEFIEEYKLMFLYIKRKGTAVGYTGQKKRDYQREWTRKENERIGGYRNSPPAGTTRFFSLACSKIKSKAKTNNIDFDLDPQYLKQIYPRNGKCPALGYVFKRGDHTGSLQESPTIDKLVPSKGYVKGNVHWVSRVANSIMSDGTPDEVIEVGKYFKEVTEDLNMTHNNRTFDRESYKQNDARAKKAMVGYLIAQNFSDIVAKEDYYFDVSANKKVKGKDEKFFFEVEIKNQWGSSWNPSWKEVRIPQRKQRLIDRKEKDYPDHDLYFVVFNTNCSQAWFIKAKDVNDSSVGTIQNSSRTGEPHLAEPFFHIPVEKAKLIQISY